MSDTSTSLQRIVAVDQVAAAFVFSRDGSVMGREVPHTYTDAALKQVARRLMELVKNVEALGSPVKELLCHYENYGIWLRLFGGNFGLAIFLQTGADLSLIRQPINLAILNLEKAVRNLAREEAERIARSELALAAREAEREIYRTQGEDTNGIFYRLSILSAAVIPAVGPEILEHACREAGVVLPFQNPQQVQQVVAFIAKQIDNPDLRRSFEKEAGDFVARVEKSFADEAQAQLSTSQNSAKSGKTIKKKEPA